MILFLLVWSVLCRTISYIKFPRSLCFSAVIFTPYLYWICLDLNAWAGIVLSNWWSIHWMNNFNITIIRECLHLKWLSKKKSKYRIPIINSMTTRQPLIIWWLNHMGYSSLSTMQHAIGSTTTISLVTFYIFSKAVYCKQNQNNPNFCQQTRSWIRKILMSNVFPDMSLA